MLYPLLGILAVYLIAAVEVKQRKVKL